MTSNSARFYVRVYRKTGITESWQTLGPYTEGFAIQVANNYLRKGICSWVEDVKITQ